jgi:hypothetical protein
VIVTDEEVDRALAWLRDSAAELGEARSRAIKAGHWLKHVESLEYKASDSRTEADAAGELAKLYALREAAAAKIEAWRSQSANYRAMKI